MGLKRRINFGWVRDNPDPRDKPLMMANPLLAATLPPSVDLTTRHRFHVYDQGELGSCVAHATASAIEYAHAVYPAESTSRIHDQRFPVSRLFLYYQAREAMGTTKEDSGCMIRDCLKAAYNTGAPRETGWKYDISQFAQKPPIYSYKSAPFHKITSYSSVRVQISAIKQALASGLPVIFGVTLFDSFFNSPDVPLPALSESLQGGHCMLAVGYDDSTRRVKFLNSWGVGWGNAGFGTIPYSYIGDNQFGDDYWTITDDEYKERM